MVRSVSLLSLVALTAAGQVFTWTDKEGVVHYTDNPTAVPANVKATKTEGAEISLLTTDTTPARAPVKEPRRDERKAGAVDAVDERLEALLRSEREWRLAFRDLHERIARLQDEIDVDQRKVEDVNGLPVSARFQCMNAYGYGPLLAPPAVVAPGGSVTVMGQSQGVPGFTVGGSVVVRQTPLVLNNVGFATTPCVLVPNPEFERAKERLELNRKALARAQGELADLDRRASFEGVPREWRR